MLLDRLRPGRLLSGTVMLGLLGSVLLAAGALGAAAVLVHDPLLSGGPLSWIRYGHGRDLARTVLYIGFGLLVWAWVRLGRDVLRGTAGGRQVLVAAGAWIVPILACPPMFTRDVYSYLAQGALALRGLDPYEVGPSELPPGPLTDNVHYLWQTTPAPYGPLFILISKLVYRATGNSTLVGVIGMRLVLLVGLALLVYALPRLAERLGGSTPITLWLVVANPMMVVHLVGGPHNDLLMIGLLATGTLLVLQRRHAAGIAVVTVAMAVKATAGLALPFLVWIWAARMSGSNPWTRLVKAASSGLAVFVPVFTAITLISGVGLGWIPALSAPSAIVNWMSLPTGVGQVVHGVVWLFTGADRGPFIATFRVLGLALLAWIALRQWWLARRGGPDTVRRAAVALLWAALLSPTTLPWYLTWALALGAGFAWTRRGLAIVVAASTWLVLASYPTGEAALYSPVYLLGTVLVSAVAAAALQRPDPLRIRPRPRPADVAQPAPEPATTGVR
ncbi:MAG: hypothetical protein GEV09_25115 [Pseudonocardiaceae bacterium]|nr:hypothetical protein [Pseudonocardiaceae bacterium]